MDTTKRNEVTELTRFGLLTFLNIGQMAWYRYQYAWGKELQRFSPVLVSADEVAQNRDKMFYHAGLAGLGVLGLLVFGIACFD